MKAEIKVAGTEARLLTLRHGARNLLVTADVETSQAVNEMIERKEFDLAIGLFKPDLEFLAQTLRSSGVTTIASAVQLFESNGFDVPFETMMTDIEMAIDFDAALFESDR